MNIYEFLTFPDISNNINAVLFYPQKSYRHSALRDGCLASLRSNERFLADGKRRLRRLADTCLQSYKLFEKVLLF